MKDYDPYYDTHYFGEDNARPQQNLGWQQGHSTMTPERSTAVTLIGLFYLVMCGLGVLQGGLGLLLALIEMDGAAMLLGIIGLAINGFLAYSGYALYKRENWARQVIIAVNYINIFLFVVGLVGACGFALFSAINGQMAIGGIIVIVLIMCLLFSAIPLVISWVIINKLESDAVVRECTPTSIFHDDRFTHTFE